jgi:predicted TIM-barrel fold metal-dependent hydrolase
MTGSPASASTTSRDEKAWRLQTPEAAALLDESERLGVPVLLQARVRHAGELAAIASERPGLVIVVDYLGAEAFRGDAGRDALDRLRVCGNVLFKLLSVLGDAPRQALDALYHYAWETLGPERVLLGSDFPYVRGHASYSEAIEWLCSIGVEASSDLTARRLWRLPSPSLP